MEKKTLSNILDGKVFQIPDYQRGYAWEEKQWKDFVLDIDALIDEDVNSHYTGTIVIYQPQKCPKETYGTRQLDLVEIVDGQQRLTTCTLYLSIIIHELIKNGFNEYSENISTFLYSGSKCKLKLNNETDLFFYDLICKGVSNIKEKTIHQKRIMQAYQYFKNHISEQIIARENYDYLSKLFNAIVDKLNFSFYVIEEESEIGMTFELMNSRGKDLSSMELLKNYLMYWVYRNITDDSEKQNFTDYINNTWKNVYYNISICNGSESQCLRIAWTIFVKYLPKYWSGYSGFKDEDVIPIRDFSKKSKDDVKTFIKQFIDGLTIISKHYSYIINPNEEKNLKNEYFYLSKITNAGNIANFLPIMVAVRINWERQLIKEEEYINLLKVLELYSYRVFLWEGKRSNAGMSQFYRWSNEYYNEKSNLENIIKSIYETINWYSNENKFRKMISDEFYGWYNNRRLLKYTLFEYELHLLKGKSQPKLRWDELTDSTIEHILPQNPKKDSYWFKVWDKGNIKLLLHDISNLTLTKDNSHYLNFEFLRKKDGIDNEGNKISDYYYADSNIKQEREIAKYNDWRPEDCKERRIKLINWIIKSWGIEDNLSLDNEIIIDEDEDTVFKDID